MSKSAVVALGAAALLASAVAQAGGYIQGQVGVWGGMNTPDNHMNVPNATHNTHDVNNNYSGRVSFGYLFDTETPLSYGVELGYTDYQDNTYHAVNSNDYHLRYQRSDWDLLGVARYQLMDQVNVFGKAGLAYAEQHTKMKAIDLSKEHHQFEPELAVGAGYDFTKSIGANISYHYTYGDKPKRFSESNQPSKNQLSRVAPVQSLFVGLSYQF